MERDTNLRDFKISSSGGKDAKESSQLVGEATPMTAAQKASNSTTQYETTAPGGYGPLGGKNAGK